MAEQLTRERVLELAAKFLNMTEEKGASPTEAANAAAMLQSLLHRHQISMVDITEAERKRTCPVTTEEFVSAWKDIPDYASILCGQICQAFEVTCIYTQQRKGMKMTFVGQELDAAVAKYMYLRICDELLDMVARKGKLKGLTRSSLTDYRKAFICAAAMEIGERLKLERAKEEKAEPKMGALMVIKQEMVKDYISEMFPKLKNTPVRFSSGYGSNDGREAGRNIDLGMRGIPTKTPEVSGHIS